MARSAYDKLHALSKTASLMNGVQSLLDWDQETYMPKEAIVLRSQQTELIASLTHKQRTSGSYKKALAALIDLKSGKVSDSTLSPSQSAALREWRRDYLKAIKLPNAFVKQFAKTTSAATHAWQTAKEHNDFKAFAPHLEKIVTLCRKKADLLGFSEHPYDALLDLYEPEMRTSLLTPLFSKLKQPSC
jgi:carboxypeptidase Taq